MLVNQMLFLIQEGKLRILRHDRTALHSSPGSGLENELLEVQRLTLETHVGISRKLQNVPLARRNHILLF